MARTGLGWRAQDLADKAGVGYSTVARFEAGSPIADESREKLRVALEGAGARFSRRSDRLTVSVGYPSIKAGVAAMKRLDELKEVSRLVGKVKVALRDARKREKAGGQ